MDILVTYDVNTETKAGRKRLRTVATICCGFGQRVQNSVFECTVTPAQLEALEQRLVDTIDPKVDRLRIYRIPGDREKLVKVYGVALEYDIREPLIV